LLQRACALLQCWLALLKRLAVLLCRHTDISKRYKRRKRVPPIRKTLSDSESRCVEQQTPTQVDHRMECSHTNTRSKLLEVLADLVDCIVLSVMRDWLLVNQSIDHGHGAVGPYRHTVCSTPCVAISESKNAVSSWKPLQIIDQSMRCHSSQLSLASLAWHVLLFAKERLEVISRDRVAQCSRRSVLAVGKVLGMIQVIELLNALLRCCVSFTKRIDKRCRLMRPLDGEVRAWM
jgi:hypothetical protein